MYSNMVQQKQNKIRISFSVQHRTVSSHNDHKMIDFEAVNNNWKRQVTRWTHYKTEKGNNGNKRNTVLCETSMKYWFNLTTQHKRHIAHGTSVLKRKLLNTCPHKADTNYFYSRKMSVAQTNTLNSQQNRQTYSICLLQLLIHSRCMW